MCDHNDTVTLHLLVPAHLSHTGDCSGSGSEACL